MFSRIYLNRTFFSRVCLLVSIIILESFQVAKHFSVSFFSLLSIISLYNYTKICLSVHPLVDNRALVHFKVVSVFTQ